MVPVTKRVRRTFIAAGAIYYGGRRQSTIVCAAHGAVALTRFLKATQRSSFFCGIELNRCAYASPGTLAVDSLYEVVLFMKTDR
ncbi:MAG TPA: hypothetical protein VFX54_20445, partial [Candidatus Binatia bacterium]|nr:hypothetical protein [Candidatus Binatia bacterium]